MSNLVIAETDTEFKAILADAGDRPVLVDFHAHWCGPCKMMAPALQAYAAAHPEVLVVKADLDEVPDAAITHGIRSVPTLELVRGGKVVAKRIGAQSAAQITEFVEQVLAA